MRNNIFNYLKLTAISAPLSVFGLIYIKAVLSAFQEHKIYEQKIKDNPQDFKTISTVWSRFKYTYFPLFPLVKEQPTQDNQKKLN